MVIKTSQSLLLLPTVIAFDFQNILSSYFDVQVRISSAQINDTDRAFLVLLTTPFNADIRLGAGNVSQFLEPSLLRQP